ncbi:MAG: protein-disulfide reductase DsbD domain-containing protein [Bacteroidota bacterium]
MSVYRGLLFSVLGLCFCVSCSTENDFTDDQYVRLLSSKIQIDTNGQKTVQLQFEVAEGYHIMTNEVSEDNFITTKLTLSSNEAIQFGIPRFSEAVVHYLEGVEQPLMVFEGVFSVTLPFRTTAAILPDLEGELYYQACDKGKCFFPRELGIVCKD